MSFVGPSYRCWFLAWRTLGQLQDREDLLNLPDLPAHLSFAFWLLLASRGDRILFLQNSDCFCLGIGALICFCHFDSIVDLSFSAYARMQKPKIKEFKENQSTCPYGSDIYCLQADLHWSPTYLTTYCQKCTSHWPAPSSLALGMPVCVWLHPLPLEWSSMSILTFWLSDLAWMCILCQ